MPLRETFERLLRESEGFAARSMGYIDYEDIREFHLAERSERLLLLTGIDGEGRPRAHFAANDAGVLAAALEKWLPGGCYIEFIPEGWVPALESIGYRIESEFADFWIDALPAAPDGPAPEFLGPDDFAEASRLTYRCAGLSRGFHGEPADFFGEWLADPKARVLAERIDGRLAGVLMTTLYGFESERGPVVWIRLLAVDPDFQGRGVGGRLLSAALRWGKRGGAARAFLHADVENAGAVRLYGRRGFERHPGRGQINMAKG